MNLTERMDALRVGPGQLGLYFLGQVGLALKGPDGVLYIDPYLTGSDGAGGQLPRTFAPPVLPHEVTNAAAALLTHDHIDHFDPATLEPLVQASPGVRLFAPAPCEGRGLPVTVPAVFEPFAVGSATITAIPSAHTELEYDPARGARGYPYLGYVVEWNGVTLYHAGDTVIYGPALEQELPGLLDILGRWRLDVACVPINGRDYFRTSGGLVGNTDLREAAELAEALDIGVLVPTHYDLFAGNAADPGQFVSYLYGLNPRRRSKVMRPGELYLYDVNG